MKQWEIKYISRFYVRLSEVLPFLGTESLFSLLVFNLPSRGFSSLTNPVESLSIFFHLLYQASI